ncbi:MAG: helix-turn-helix transcriptional regulator [Planctomycetota bacterium]
MSAVGQRIRELRKTKGYTLRQLAPMVGVGFSYLCKVENGRLDSSDSPSESLIHRLAETLDGDEDELLLLARRIPPSIANRIFEMPEAFRTLAECNDRQLKTLAKQARKS